jgi:dienelactone hydrolase
MFQTLLLLCIFLSGIGIYHLLNTDLGKISVSEVFIPDGDQRIGGLLYRPIQGAGSKPWLAAVVLAHGISSSKQSLSAIALELSRRGVVSLAIDLVGHGSSDGSLGSSTDPSLGVTAAIKYLEAQSFVDSSRLGMVGHSLGAGAIRAAATAQGSIRASVFIGGGLDSMTVGPAYGSLNATFPRNLLMVVGREDVLFDIEHLKKELLPVFNTSHIAAGQLFGDFARQNARKLVTPATTHLFEPLDPETVSETVSWMESALNDVSTPTVPVKATLIYPFREAALSASSLALLGLVFPLSALILAKLPPQKRTHRNEGQFLEDWKVFAILGILGLGTLVPMFFVGLIVPFPPLIFGSSFAWWLLAVAALGLVLAKTLLPRISGIRLELKPLVAELFSRSAVMTAFMMLFLLYGSTSLVEAIFATDLRVLTPLLSAPRLPSRILLVPVFIPFFLAYFLMDELYLCVIREKTGGVSWLTSVARVVFLNSGPYMIVLGVQYLPMFLLGVRPLAGMVGFLMEFLWGIVPLFIITTVFSWWFYRKTQSIGTGALFNALLFAWSAASIFPFRG